jgi:hypothetical protein
MASSGSRKTTMAKLNRERKLRERRVEKQARKDARKQASADQQGDSAEQWSEDAGAGEDALDPVAHALGDD